MPDSDEIPHGFLPIKELLGASEVVSVQQISIYLPDKDKDGRFIDDHEIWVDQGLEILSAIGGGASALQDVLGAWLNPENGQLIKETTTIVYTYIVADRLIDQIPRLRALLHEFGSSTNQGEVLFHVAGQACRI